jgi:uncharacterized membrane protein YvlD (DUF360 family)
MTRFRIPGQRIFEGIRNPTVRAGLLTGVYLCVVMVVSVLAATRLPFLEPFAEIRNWAARGAFVVVLLIPLLCFLRKPVQLLGSGILGWTIFALGYKLMGLFFNHLHDRLDITAFHAFMLGAVFYLVAAATSWVLSMLLEARQHPIADTRRKM